MRTEMAPYAVPLLLAAGLLFATMVYSLRRRSVSGAASLSLLAFFAAWWAFADGMLVLSSTWDAYEFWWKAGYVGIFGLPVALLIFALDYAGHREHLTARNIAAFSIPVVIALFLVMTEPRHDLMWTVLETNWSQPYVPTVQRGIAFWFITLYVYALMLAASVILMRLFKRSHRVYKRQTYLMLAAIVLPFLPSVIHVLGINPILEFDYTPIALAFSAPALVISVFKFRLRDFVPVARRAVFDELDDGVMIVSLDGTVIDINPAAMVALGVDMTSDLSMPIAKLNPELAHTIAAPATTATGFSAGEPQRHYDLTVSTIDDHRGGTAARVVVFRDATERWILERQLEYSAERDALTGLLNRARFDARLQARWNDDPSEITLMFIDLDNFKPVNDQHGHHTGDEVLKIIGNRIANALPDDTDVARWGGDEFAVAIKTESRTKARAIALDLRAEIERPVELSGDISASISASIGLAFGRDVDSAASLLQEADTRMYADKARRRISTSELSNALFDTDRSRAAKR